MLDTQDQLIGDDDKSPVSDISAPRRQRRRSASRPAGPPAVPVAEPLAVAANVVSDAASDAEKPKRRTRKKVEKAVADSVAEAPSTGAVAIQEPSSVAAVADASTDVPKKRTRKRIPAKTATISEAAAADSSAETPVAVSETASDAGSRKAKAEIDATAVAAVADVSDAEQVKPKRRTTRRKKVDETLASTKDEILSLEKVTGAEVKDSVEAALAELPKMAVESERRPRRRSSKEKVAAFGVVADSSDAVLESLAAAIGGAVPEEATIEDIAVADANGDEDSELRRRRRRGGRRRRRSEESGDETSQSDIAEQTVENDTAQPEPDASEDGEAADNSTVRRRRRRRRRGEEIAGAEDDPKEVVVKVRDPHRTRTTAEVTEEVSSIDGSTRVEAKKQRRREGRAAGRRRAPVLSESEFLARRESVDRQMVIRQAADYSQIAVLEDGILVEHYVDRASSTSMIGNIYLGRVQNVLPSMEAAFIDIGRGRNAVLYAGEIDWESYGEAGEEKKIEDVFKSGQNVLVQVSKDPVGAKGARMTSHISLSGRYIVYSPGGQLSGISRKLSETERRRLREILDRLIDPSASVIVRTAAEGIPEEELVHDVNRLKAQWEVIEKKSQSQSAPQLLYSEPDLTVRIVRDLFTEDFSSLVVDSSGVENDAYATVEAYVQHVAPHLSDRVQRWDRETKGDLFDFYRIQEQIAKALERKVFLPSGGSLIVDRTEAMTVIDVNTGKFTGSQGNLEATVTANNLEAAEEIVRQLRLRDIGGIVVIDFIDMVLPSNRELLLRRLVECLGRDRTRHQVAEVTSLGLVQLTRKKIGTGLAEAFTVPCETCLGRGYHTHDVPVASQAPTDGGERENKRRGVKKGKSKKKP